MHPVRTNALSECGRVCDVTEEHRDELALALDGASDRQDFIGQVARSVAQWVTETL